MTRRRATLVLLSAVYRMAIGIAFATPIAVLWAGIVGEHPRSAAVLWESGGYWLLESVVGLLRGFCLVRGFDGPNGAQFPVVAWSRGHETTDLSLIASPGGNTEQLPPRHFPSNP